MKHNKIFHVSQTSKQYNLPCRAMEECDKTLTSLRIAEFLAGREPAITGKESLSFQFRKRLLKTTSSRGRF